MYRVFNASLHGTVSRVNLFPVGASILHSYVKPLYIKLQKVLETIILTVKNKITKK
jgi:hypothetical protein